MTQYTSDEIWTKNVQYYGENIRVRYRTVTSLKKLNLVNKH